MAILASPALVIHLNETKFGEKNSKMIRNEVISYNTNEASVVL